MVQGVKSVWVIPIAALSQIKNRDNQATQTQAAMNPERAREPLAAQN